MNTANTHTDAINPEMVGVYDAHCFSGGGYFYDQVLEYRVWCHPERGAEDIYQGDDYFYAFATFAEALAYSQQTAGAETPLVLIRQYEYINEPTPGVFEHCHGERITEWQPQWLADSKREPDSIARFLQQPPI